MTFSTPPRGRGRHWRDDALPAARREDEFPRHYPPQRPPPEPEPEDDTGDIDCGDFPTDPTLRVPLNQPPPPPYPTGETVHRYQTDRTGPGYLDVIVPRIYLEPDEMMDALRRRALRWGIARDAVVVVGGLYLLGSWVVPAVWRFLGL